MLFNISYCIDIMFRCSVYGGHNILQVPHVFFTVCPNVSGHTDTQTHKKDKPMCPDTPVCPHMSRHRSPVSHFYDTYYQNLSSIIHITSFSLLRHILSKSLLYDTYHQFLSSGTIPPLSRFCDTYHQSLTSENHPDSISSRASFLHFLYRLFYRYSAFMQLLIFY